MEAALASLCAHAEDAITQGYNIIILSDRKRVGRTLLPIPALLATAAVHQHLVTQGPAHVAPGLVVETGSAREVHHFALLAGLRRRGDPSVPRARDARASCADRCPAIDHKESCKRFIKAICKGLYKVMSKMGISTYQSYCGAQIFEAVGLQTALRRQVLHRHGEQRRGHRPVRGRRGGRAPASRSRSATIRCCATCSTPGGEYQYRMRGEAHMWTPESIAKLQHATRAEQLRDVRGVREAHQRAEPRAEDAARALRASRPRERTPVPLEEVEPAKDDRQALRHRRDEPRARSRPRRTRRSRSR